MSSTHTATALHTAASEIAARISAGTTTSDEHELLLSDEGLLLGEVGVAWLRPEDTTVVAWGGNDVDPDMTRLVEIPAR